MARVVAAERSVEGVGPVHITVLGLFCRQSYKSVSGACHDEIVGNSRKAFGKIPLYRIAINTLFLFDSLIRSLHVFIKKDECNLFNRRDRINMLRIP